MTYAFSMKQTCIIHEFHGDTSLTYVLPLSFVWVNGIQTGLLGSVGYTSLTELTGTVCNWVCPKMLRDQNGCPIN